MSGLQTLDSVRYVTAKGQRFAVLSMDAWETLIAWIENQEDRAISRKRLAELKSAGRDPEKAGWVAWDTVREEL